MNEACRHYGINPATLPSHVAIIMDGNGRWAKRRLLPRAAGHKKGVDRVREIVETSARVGISTLSLYAFSDENWKRPNAEIETLMNLLRQFLQQERKYLLDNRVKVRILGDRKTLPHDIQEMIHALEVDSNQNLGLRLNIALSYGSRSEITRACQRIAELVESGKLPASAVDSTLIENHLDTAGLPPVDMVIRTSGEQRISNFLLWQCAYAEFFFESTMWPDFDNEKYARVLKEYAGRERRFGRTSEQLKAEGQGMSTTPHG